jgi:FkbM family methyltransferase
MEHFVENLLKHVNGSNGFYVECGANDGVLFSYTYELEKMGWRGLLIEPSLSAFNRCRVNRSRENGFYNCALVATEDVDRVYGDFDGGYMSGVQDSCRNRRKGLLISCKAKTLNSILEEQEIKSIDLLSIDVEGYEMEVLKGFDIRKYTPKYVIIEIHDELKQDIFDFMSSVKYIVLDNLTNYNNIDFPPWDGTHNDFLFVSDIKLPC